MKKLLLILVIGVFCVDANAQFAEVYNPVKSVVPEGEKGYTIRGEIANAKDGMKVFLLNDLVWPVLYLDSTEIRGGRFMLTGYVEYPIQLKVVIDDGSGNEENLLSSSLYLENSDISFVADVNMLQPYYYNPEAGGKVPAVIRGSKENDLFLLIAKEENKIRDRKDSLEDEYYSIYMTGEGEDVTYNVKEAIPLMKQIKACERELREMRLSYIRQYPGMSVIVDLLDMEIRSNVYINYTLAELDQLENLVVNANPRRVEELKGWFARAKRTAIGAKYSDMELTDVDGKRVKLSDYIPEGKYVLLDFWMSGCGPCRAENPHVKQVYEKYKDKLVVLGIAGEPNIKDWLKAVEEENMPWIQLYDGNGFECEDGIFTKMNIVGFPTCVLLDKEGRFFKTDMRGANMEIILEELFGK